MRKSLKYALLFLGSSVLIISTSLYAWYWIEHNQWQKDSEKGGSSYWNKDRTLLTLESGYPSLFIKDPNRQVTIKNEYDYYEPWKYSNMDVRLDENNQNSPWVYSSNNFKNTTYIFKTKQDFINLFRRVSSEIHSYPNEDFIIKEFKELLDDINFEIHDLILLNNYYSPSMPSRGDRRKIGWDIKNYKYDYVTNTLWLEWTKNYKMKKYFWISDSSNWINDKAIGSNSWYRSYFLILNKTKVTDSNEINLKIEYDWIK